jgi:hypothetical protein
MTLCVSVFIEYIGCGYFREYPFTRLERTSAITDILSPVRYNEASHVQISKWGVPRELSIHTSYLGCPCFRSRPHPQTGYIDSLGWVLVLS